jgi:hypothetical protein
MSRYKYDRMKFGLPLTTPESKRTFRCYASHGKGYGFASTPKVWGALVRILGVNAARETRWADGVYIGQHNWSCTALAQGGWKRLGWIMADDSLPFGELDDVDPELAQYEYLPATHRPEQEPSFHT